MSQLVGIRYMLCSGKYVHWPVSQIKPVHYALFSCGGSHYNIQGKGHQPSGTLALEHSIEHVH